MQGRLGFCRGVCLAAYACAISKSLEEENAIWRLDVDSLADAFVRYERWYEKGEKNGADVLGLPLLALLAFRTIAEDEHGGDELFGNPSALYEALIDITCKHAGKADDGVEGAVHRGGTSLRRLLRRVASIMTILGSESVSFRELERRLADEPDLLAWASDKNAENALQELVVNFYFRSNRNLGCQFLHKSFREYLFAESVVAVLESAYESKGGALECPSNKYFEDFRENQPQYGLSRSLGKLLTPHWMSREVKSHIFWLISQRISSDGEQWIWIRDLLADIYGWWFEGAHLRPQSVSERGKNAWRDPVITELLVDVLPYDENTESIPQSATSLDAHFGDALLQLTAFVHAEAPDAPPCGERAYQRRVRDRAAFQPAREFAYQLVSRIGSAAWRSRFGLGHVYLREVSLANANLTGAHLSDANLSDANLNRANLSRANLTGASVIGGDLGRADLSDALLSRAILSRANLIGTNLSCANFSEADLSHAKLVGANLIGAKLIGASLSRADLSRSHFSRAHLIDADLSGADLSGADLSGANLSGANLSDADLGDADLSGANLKSADLSRANLISADLSGADLSGAQLKAAVVPESALSQEQRDEALGLD